MHTIYNNIGNESPAFVDIDGDGRPDILCNDPVNKKMIWLKSPSKKADTLWKKYIISNNPDLATNMYTHGLGWGDINHDGSPDVIITKGWWESPKDVNKADWIFHPVDLGEDCSQMYVLDLDGDGDADVISASAHDYGIWWHEQIRNSDGNITFKHHVISNAFSETHGLALADINADGHPDLILVNDATGESIVNYYGGALGVAYLGSSYLDRSGSPDWKLVVPSRSAPAMMGTTNSVAASGVVDPAGSNSFPEQQANTNLGITPILIFNGTGTSPNDVIAVEKVVSGKGLAYHTANSSQLDGLSQSQLLAYKLFIVPGGNSITIGNNLSSKATSTVRAAVAQGLNYLGICAGGFFGGYSKYNGLDLTSGKWFTLYADYFKGIHKEPVAISFPGGTKLDIYWENGPSLSGWGQVVGKYPNGATAITEGYWGKGFVLMSGVHPEAPAGWRGGMHFFTPVEVDLAYAATLVTSALNRVTLPHF